LHLGKPIQIIKELTLEAKAKDQQNEATKAWNFCTALYYKANQTVPWRLITNLNKPSTCFVGISFYRSRNRKILNTSLAQIFNELGQNVILRGTPVDVDKNDRRPYLTDEQAYSLLLRALEEYTIAMRNSPGRLVLHKSSRYKTDEIKGFEAAAAEFRIPSVDFITILDSDLRLLRGGEYPVYRGTYVELSRSEHLLYTRGSVEHYETQTSKYIPQPLEIRITQSDESPKIICQEILGLSKMNWNNTQFDGKYPITLVCARRVGQIMKYLDEEKDEPQVSYSFYM
jgi:argonaute-like protein implicated in RNA metabolism and viral defense